MVSNWLRGGYMFKIQKLDKVNKQSANISRTIRFPEDLYNNYNKLAQDTGVSFNSLVLHAMRYAYNDLEIEDNSKNKK
jgi:hypothetical protein